MRTKLKKTQHELANPTANIYIYIYIYILQIFLKRRDPLKGYMHAKQLTLVEGTKNTSH